ncbi:MAG: 2-aminoethylphosphonate--pyruvate transaminase [Coxiellaceae bacterium]|nr:2-aminoethylphosphonate--pyruvate transaminase [Coxiellaceae bacterium]
MNRKILLNPGPVTTTDGVKNAMLVDDICHREQEFTDLVQAIRSDLLKVANADDDYSAILFTASGTGALEACLSSVVANNQTIAIINNGSYGERLIKIAQRYGLDVLTIDQPADQPLDLQAIEDALKNNNISFLAMVHHETSLGTLNPLNAVGELCEKYQCEFIVDAMSSFAGSPIHMHNDHIDYLISSSNKCLHGMPGMAFVIAHRESLKNTEGNARSFYFDLHQQHHALERGGEMPFTPAIQVAYAFKQALNEFFAEGAEQRIERFQHNYQVLTKGLAELGFHCVTPQACQSKLLVTVQFPNDGCNYDFNLLHDHLYAKGITIYPKKIPIANSFRLSCIGDLTTHEINIFLKELESYMTKNKKELLVNHER